MREAQDIVVQVMPFLARFLHVVTFVLILLEPVREFFHRKLKTLRIVVRQAKVYLKGRQIDLRHQSKIPELLLRSYGVGKAYKGVVRGLTRKIAPHDARRTSQHCII